MDAAQIAELAGGLLLAGLALLMLRHNRAVAEQIAEWNKFQYDRRATLYDLDRAERLRRLYEPGPLDRLSAGFLAVIVGAIGVALVVTAVP